MFEIIKPDINLQIISKQRLFMGVSAVAVLLSLAAIVFIGPTYGIDFKGGSDIILRFEENVEPSAVRDAAEAAGLPDVQVQRYGAQANHTYLVQTRAASVMNEEKSKEVQENLADLEAVTGFIWSPKQPNRARVTFEEPVETSAIKAAVERTDLQGVNVTRTSATENRYEITFEDLQTFVTEAFAESFPTQFNPQTGIARMETVGAQVGEQVRNAGILSVLVALLGIMLYVAVRFDFRYAPGGVIALLHDVIITLGFLTVTQTEITLSTVAALLTILGYSINDTIIIYDRIRENLEDADDDASVPEIANRSINETLSRTVMTNFTVLIAISAIAILGTGTIQDFAITLIVGVGAGTYSTIFVAAAIMLRIDAYMKSRREAQELIKRQTAEGSTAG
jgi:preprotein translocase subunit SecF